MSVVKPLLTLIAFIGIVLVPAACLAGPFGFQSGTPAPVKGAHGASQQPAVSIDFKHTMTAAVDPTSTLADLTIYTRDARLQIRTKQDSLIFAKFLIGVNLFGKAREGDRKISEDLEEMKAARSADSDLSMQLIKLPYTEELGLAADASAKRIASARAQLVEDKDLPDVLLAYRTEARGLFADIRKSLGIPAIPKD
jgi:hypothetical protein